MTKRPRRNHSPTFKAKVALAAIQGEKTMVELVQQFDVRANQIKQWKDQLLDGAADVFDDGRKETVEPVVDVKNLHAKIGKLTLENNFLAGALGKPGLLTMIDRNHKLPVSHQARILRISRGSVYYMPQPASAFDLALMRRINELHLDYPFAGSRMLQGLLNAEGHDVDRLHVRTLMKKMGRGDLSSPEHVQARAGPQDLSLSSQESRHHSPQSSLDDGHQLHTDGAGRRLFLRRHRLVQPPGSVLEAVDHAGDGILHRGGRRGVVVLLQARDIQHGPWQPVHVDRLHRVAEGRRDQHSMDGKGAWRDNVFVERLWR